MPPTLPDAGPASHGAACPKSGGVSLPPFWGVKLMGNRNGLT